MMQHFVSFETGSSERQKYALDWKDEAQQT